ncbi:hypothetical protein P168DRAFT_321190 [Aspergillus campestris IBT 28561]|uniref:Uncharacterized protein n=1 Tax=Aspergillus campestris (strain IBT 28561) TaxID=1392248 RepID=A0A2I1CVG2_ASPC2|nr:uncharacterized protein P168DRAFT_321190 [Aspergillus campestris IBT 28561]PKY01611.1 hypothetical protein P168DRAFT_321190 [Aspergillus campestris IBT 28561]
MKLSFLAAITLVGAAIASPVAGGKEQKPAIKEGQPCKQDGSMGNCETNYCEAKGDAEGTCKPMPK